MPISVAAFRRIVNTAGFQFFYWYALKPAVFSALVVLVWRDLLSTWYWPLVTFVLINLTVDLLHLVLDPRLRRETA